MKTLIRSLSNLWARLCRFFTLSTPQQRFEAGRYYVARHIGRHGMYPHRIAELWREVSNCIDPDEFEAGMRAELLALGILHPSYPRRGPGTGTLRFCGLPGQEGCAQSGDGKHISYGGPVEQPDGTVIFEERCMCCGKEL